MLAVSGFETVCGVLVSCAVSKAVAVVVGRSAGRKSRSFSMALLSSFSCA